jgi:hypothetical protein
MPPGAGVVTGDVVVVVVDVWRGSWSSSRLRLALVILVYLDVYLEVC